MSYDEYGKILSSQDAMNLYDHPAIYDLEYETQTEDVVFYVKMAHKYGGPVLELGCGNGRITLPIARSGIDVVGLDNNASMLQHFEEKRHSEPDSIASRVSCVEGDYRHVQLNTKFQTVLLPFNALHHCQSHHDVLALLSTVRTHLRPAGTFILDCYLPDPVLYQRDPNRRYAEQTMVHPRTHRTLTSWETSRYDALSQVHHVTYTYQEEYGERWSVHLDLRMFYPQELRALIDLGGFEIVEEHADFRGSPLTGDALKWVMVLKEKG